jgi:hypothetical protein
LVKSAPQQGWQKKEQSIDLQERAIERTKFQGLSAGVELCVSNCAKLV